MIGIINYGMGNLKSVSNALAFLNVKHLIIDEVKDLKKVDSYILPGVGAFGMAMNNIHKLGFKNELEEQILNKKKNILGLCLGMQLFFDSSEENGNFEGLSWIKGKVKSLNKLNLNLTVPHMGWNDFNIEKESVLLHGLIDYDFYYVHSFYCECDDRDDVIASVDYGVKIDVMLEKENVFGCQFHPEKSQNSGLKILSNFCKL